MYERKTLGLLQPTHQGKLPSKGCKIGLNSPMSKKRKNDENHGPSVNSLKDFIYEDPPTPAAKRSKVCNMAVQTEPTVDCHLTHDDGEDSGTNSNKDDVKVAPKKEVVVDPKSKSKAIIDMMTSDKPNEQYWEMVACERKSALTSSLIENKQLHQRNMHLQEEVHQLSDQVQTLQTENSLLEELLTEAKQLATLVAEATAEGEMEKEDKDVPEKNQDDLSLPDHCEDQSDTSSENGTPLLSSPSL